MHDLKVGAPITVVIVDDHAVVRRGLREVLRLIADGLSNAEIAETLIIGERTVKSHVTNILAKLHVADRTQAAIYAWREGIVGH